MGSCFSPFSRFESQIVTSRLGSRYGSGRSTTPSRRLNTPAVEPMPSPRARTAVMAKLGLRTRLRRAKRTSLIRVSMGAGKREGLNLGHAVGRDGSRFWGLGTRDWGLGQEATAAERKAPRC